MNWFPEKIEGKLFIITVAICLGTSIFATQWLLSTEEDSLINKAKSDLIGLSQQHEFSIFNTLNDRLVQGTEIGDTIQRAWTTLDGSASVLPVEFETNEDGSQIGISSDLISSCYISPDTNLTPELRKKISQITSIFGSVAPYYLSEFRTINFISAEGIYIAAPPYQSPSFKTAQDRIDQSILQKLQQTKNIKSKSYWTPLRLDPNSNDWLSTLVIPLYFGDSPIGALTSDYSFNHLLSRLTPTRSNEADSRTLILRGNDELILHPSLKTQIYSSFSTNNQGISIKNYSDGNLKSLISSYLDSQPSKPFIYTHKDITHIAYITDLDHNNWQLVVYMNDRQIVATLSSIRWKLTAGSLFIAFLLMLLIRDVFHRMFLRRILELEQATRDYVTKEEFVIPNPGKDEIGQLAYSFQELIQSLEAGKTQISEQAQQLEDETHERLHALVSLEESETKFRTLFEKSSDAIMLIDGEHCIDCNGSAMSLFKFGTKKELMTISLLKLAPEHQPNGQTSQEQWLFERELAFKTDKRHFEWLIKNQDNELVWVDILLTVIPYEGRNIIHAVLRDISDRKNEEMERVRLTTAIEQAAESIMITNAKGDILYVNPAFEELNQFTRNDVLNQNASMLYSDKYENDWLEEMENTVFAGKVWQGKMDLMRKDGTTYKAESTISPVRDNAGIVINFVYVSRDVSKEINMELQLRQAQKMEAIGELASGIAHEINTPTQYIGDNIRFFRDSFEDLKQLLDEYQKFLSLDIDDDAAKALQESTQKVIEDIDLAYLEEEVPLAIGQSLDGNARVAEIVRAMKEFAHPGSEECIAIDINNSIKNTISVARNEWKYVAEIETDLAPDLPMLTCYPGSLNQVILNLVVNAAHAIGDTLDENGTEKGTITLTTSHDKSHLEIRIGDSGCGIPEENRVKIFDPFFTTKAIGKGTGQGLSIAHSVVVEKHLGTIEVESEIGKGTTFIIRIPLDTLV